MTSKAPSAAMQEVAAVAYQCLGIAQAPVRVMDYFSAIANGKVPGASPLPVFSEEFGKWKKVRRANQRGQSGRG